MNRIAVFMLACSAAICGATSSASAFPVFAGSGSGAKELTVKPVTLQTVGGRKITCPSYESEYNVRNENELRLRLIGLTCTLRKAPCTSVAPRSATAGVLDIEFFGALVYLDEEHRKVALDFRPVAPDGTTSPFYINCRALGQLEFTGHVLAQVTPINKLVRPPSTFSLKFIQKEGVERWTGALNAPGQFLLAKLTEDPFYEEAGLGWATTLGFNQELEIAG